jgi:hypothetical protein
MGFHPEARQTAREILQHQEGCAAAASPQSELRRSLDARAAEESLFRQECRNQQAESLRSPGAAAARSQRECAPRAAQSDWNASGAPGAVWGALLLSVGARRSCEAFAEVLRHLHATITQPQC